MTNNTVTINKPVTTLKANFPHSKKPLKCFLSGKVISQGDSITLVTNSSKDDVWALTSEVKALNLI